ncbi:hypothetical protein QFC19_003376 [Naganishia cerealis]|uniref:Uncharacterized protein n=1 Tax=Naganishia cerealis TaxID=610337 RepID=A0ACC2W2Y3_9TREE|nr:hypothetical protein QFC19_003376 [Naganishia cerealis]
MDDNPFANPFADEDPVPVPSHVFPTGSGTGPTTTAVSPNQSPYIRKLERDGIISLDLSPSLSSPSDSAFPANPFSSTSSHGAPAPEDPFAGRASMSVHEIDAFSGGFNTGEDHTGMGLGYTLPSAVSNSMFSEATPDSPPPPPVASALPPTSSSQTTTPTSYNDSQRLQVLGLAPEVDPTAGLKAAFVRKSSTHAVVPAVESVGAEGEGGAEQQGHAVDAAAGGSEQQETHALQQEVNPSPKPRSDGEHQSNTDTAKPKPAPPPAVRAPVRRRKKVVGISVGDVEREREREHERLEKERIEKQRLEKERMETARTEKEQAARQEQEKPEPINTGTHILQQQSILPDSKPSDVNADAESDKEGSKPSVNAAADGLGHTIATNAPATQGSEEQDGHVADEDERRDTGKSQHAEKGTTHIGEDDLSALPALPTSEAGTRPGSPALPASASAPVTTHATVAKASSHSPFIPNAVAALSSPLDNSPHHERGSANATRIASGSGGGAWGRAFDEEDEPAVGSSVTAESGLVTGEGGGGGWAMGSPSPTEPLSAAPGSAGWADQGEKSGHTQVAHPAGWGEEGDGYGGYGAGMRGGFDAGLDDQHASRSLMEEGAESTVSLKSHTFDAPPSSSPRDGHAPSSTPPPAPAKPAFIIRIHDPTRVGDPIRGHVVYTVSTRTTSPHFATTQHGGVGESSVLRRFSQFLWLVEQLGANNPGVIVPPVPDKQISGRFEDQFVETRRAALEKCLNKVANHPVLSLDPDLRLFLESESFEYEVKHRKHETAHSQDGKGLLASIGGSIGGPRFIERDDWFDEKKAFLDSLEGQMKGLIKSVETASKHRLDLSTAISDFSESITALAESDLSMDLSQALQRFAGLTIREREAQEGQAKADVVCLLNTADEYVRWIGSVRAETDARRLKSQHEKLRRSGKIAHERIPGAVAEIGEAERKALDAHSDFDAVSRLVKSEFGRYEQDRVAEFKYMLERYLDGMIGVQKEVRRAGSGSSATLGAKGRKGISKKQLQGCDIVAACDQIMNPPQPIALRTSAGLMMGVVKIHDARYDLVVHDVTTLEMAVKRATLHGAHASTKDGGNLTTFANGANARLETITVQHQPGQGFAPNLDLEQAGWEKFLRSYGKEARAASMGPLPSQEDEMEDSSNDSANLCISLVAKNNAPLFEPRKMNAARAESRSATPEPERARNASVGGTNDVRRYRQRSSSLLLPAGIHHLASDAADTSLDAAGLFTPLTARGGEGTDTLLRDGVIRRSGNGISDGSSGRSVLLAHPAAADSSFSAAGGEQGVGDYYAPVDLGFDLGLDLPPMEEFNDDEGYAMDVDDAALDLLRRKAGTVVSGYNDQERVDLPVPNGGGDLQEQTIECTREELEAMKINYKARMVDARFQKLVEEEHKQVFLSNVLASIAPELANYWTLVSARPYEIKEGAHPEFGQKRGGTRRTAAGTGTGLPMEQDGPLAGNDDGIMMLDLEMQGIDEQDRDRLGSDESKVLDYYAALGGSSTVGTGTGPRLSLATPQLVAERIARRARSSSILGSNLSGSAQRRAMLGDDSMLDDSGHLERFRAPNGPPETFANRFASAVPDEALPLEQDPVPEGPSQSSLLGHANVNERQFLEYESALYLQQHSESRLPEDDDDDGDNDVFGDDQVVDFFDVARPAEHKRAIAVNAFVSVRESIRKSGGVTRRLMSVGPMTSFAVFDFK